MRARNQTQVATSPTFLFSPETTATKMVEKGMAMTHEKHTVEVPDCHYPNEPVLVKPKTTTRRHSLYLSNLDDQKFLRFSIKYLYVYGKGVGAELLKGALSRALVEYYPLAGRLRSCGGDGDKLEVDCNGEGAVFAEGHVEMTAVEFLGGVARPNRSWRKLLYKVETQSFVDVPPLVVQVTHLSCGGMILCTAINHSLCDGIGTAQFLHAWAHFAIEPDVDLLTHAFHGREMLKPRFPPTIRRAHPVFNPSNADGLDFDLLQCLLSQDLVPVFVTFTPGDVLRLKQKCATSLKCTSFEALASHVWRVWIRSLAPPAELKVKLLFSVNIRARLCPQLPTGFCGNGFVLGCAETTVEDLLTSNLGHAVELVQGAKKSLDDEYVRSMVDLLEEKRSARPDLSASLVISQWSKLGLENLDFGGGKPLHMSPLASEIYCIFLPVVGDVNSFTVLISVPEKVAGKVECGLKDAAVGEGE